MLDKILDYPPLWDLSRFFLDLTCGLYRKRIALLKASGLVKDNASVLDIGCGTGLFAEVTQGDYLGIDLNHRSITRAMKKKFKTKKTFRCVDLNLVQKELPKFDVILIADVLHHLDNQGCVDLLKTSLKLTNKYLVSFEPVFKKELTLLEKCIKYLSMDVLGIRLDLVQIPEVIKSISGWIEERNWGNYIVLSNANDVVTARRNVKVRNATNSSSLTVADGISLVLLSRLRGHPLKKRVYGPDLMLELLKSAEMKGCSNFFYGTTQITLDLLIDNLRVKFPRLKIAGAYSPPFAPLSAEEDEKIIELINKTSPEIIWVGLGTPKQQLWMYEHRDKLKVPVMLGVGAAFDFFAGIKPQAPRWIREIGFEWLFRLITEPKRLWRRYLINNLLFIYYVAGELIFKVIPSTGSKPKQ
jgi:N-acetylglucosaminyldiphosphoundecaprenol N-acetyl-beta-D-mannosaminyltransferase